MVRYTLLSGHYRQPLNFTLHSLDASHQALLKLAKFEKQLRALTQASEAPSLDELKATGKADIFAEAWADLLNDLNVPGAIGAVFATLNKTKPAALSVEAAKSAWIGLHFVLAALGLELPVIKDEGEVEAPEEVKALADQRWNAKQARDWTTSDDLRKQIELLGWIVKDSKEGYTLTPQA
ncbi:hypothetical protein [Verrucomicrobium spinosum]|uniref:hypothetical protein n=1 Tax=Verrucomicrobium spinosum TaxID=2736 RepID=UPI000AD801DB|nr:hypothetical protein [Verrucomicrobium spinosum]